MVINAGEGGWFQQRSTIARPLLLLSLLAKGIIERDKASPTWEPRSAFRD
jgi:hypothetical protein